MNVRPALLGIAVLLAAALTACASPYDAYYDAARDFPGYEEIPNDTLLSTGEITCESLDDGSTRDAEIASYVDVGMSGDEAAHLVDAAIDYLCPIL